MRWLAFAIVLCGCGTAPAPAARDALGVQSNGETSRTLLRLHPAGPMTFATALEVHVRSELLGRPIAVDVETRGVRRVVEVRGDGTIAMEEIDTSSRYGFSMMGDTESGGGSRDAPPVPRRYVLGERGTRVPDTTSLLSGFAPTPRAGVQRLGGAIDPIVRAFELPEQPIATGDSWHTNGHVDLADVNPGMTGALTYSVLQRLERFEGSGSSRVAIVGFEGTLAGSGQSGADRLEGTVTFRGYYTMLLTDGFARAAEARIEGEARMGELVRLPISGELQWLASPIE